MLDIILIVLMIVSLFKPEVMVNKKVRAKATTEELNILAKGYRKLYLSIVLMLEGAVFAAETSSTTTLCVIGLVVFAIGAFLAIKNHVISKVQKENKALTNEILARTDEVVTVDPVAEEEVKSEEA